MKKVQFDKSCDLQKDEMKRERAVKEAQRRKVERQDSNVADFARAINPPPFFSPRIRNQEFASPSVARRPTFSQSLRECAPPTATPFTPPRMTIGSGRPRISENRSSLRSVFGDSNGSVSTGKKQGIESYKTALCHEWRESGVCSYAENCKYAHGVEELRPPIQASPHYKTVLCRNFTMYGDCPHGSKCKFVHRRDGNNRASLFSASLAGNSLFSSSAASNSFFYQQQQQAFGSSYLGVPPFSPMMGLPFNTSDIMRQSRLNSSRQLQ